MPKPAQATKARKQQQAAMPEVATARHTTAIPSFDELPDSAFIREAQLVQSPKRPGSTAPLPFSAPTLWRKVKNGTFVKPVKLSERVTAFNVGAVRAWIAAQTAGQSEAEIHELVNRLHMKRAELVKVEVRHELQS